jgi:hypothetical protein
MWVTIALAAANLVLGLIGTLLLGLPGFDITPVAMVIIALSGENIVVGALLVSVAYMVARPARFAFIWLQVPVAVIVGYSALWTGNIYIPLFVFHALSVGAGVLMGMFDGRYLLYTIVSLALNFAAARMYGLLM